MKLTPKNWAEFQHYKDRSPPWIKLHKTLMFNYDFVVRLPVASRALAPMLWLLASEFENGVIDASLEKVAFRCHMTAGEVAEALNPLVEADFFTLEQDASTSLACRYQDATLETEGETQVKLEEEGAEAHRSVKKDRRRATRIPDGLTANRAAQEAAGLTAAEGDREFMKFRNHAHEKGRTCVDWEAAERNWYLKSAEFMGRKPPAATVPGKTLVFVDAASPAFRAWEIHLGAKQPTSKGGWYFESEYPPGYEPKAA